MNLIKNLKEKFFDREQTKTLSAWYLYFGSLFSYNYLLMASDPILHFVSLFIMLHTWGFFLLLFQTLHRSFKYIFNLVLYINVNEEITFF